jgi:hypothetical protein
LTKNIDKFPKNMFFARAISNGVKWFCPDVFSGPVYTLEEMEQTTEDITHEEVGSFTAELVKEEIPTLTDKQFDKLLLSDLPTIQKHLTAITEGKLNATQLQELALKNKVVELTF